MWDGHHEDLPIFVEDQFPDFIKYHLNGEGKAPWGDLKVVFHSLREPDLTRPHDHPWGFNTFIMQGGYTEEVFEWDADSNNWKSWLVDHAKGDAWYVPATHIHRIVAPRDNCMTCAIYGPWERDWKAYDV